MRLVYFGTPEEAVPPLRALIDQGHEIPLVVTQPDSQQGRGRQESSSPVKIAATELGLTVRTPSKSKEVIEDVRSANAEIGIVVAFGQILPDELLQATQRGFLNIHFSLLPKWRGAAPVERSILAGDTETGVSIMQMEHELDTGPVWAMERTPIGDSETAGELRSRLVDVGTPLLVATISKLDSLQPIPQVGEPTYAHKMTVDEFAINWRDTSAVIDRMVRAANPKPGAFTTMQDQRLKIFRARSLDPASIKKLKPGQVDESGYVGTGDGALQLLEVQPASKRSMPASAWLAGLRTPPVFDLV